MTPLTTPSTLDLPLDAEEGREPLMQPARTKVVATIGPASENRIGELIDAGMSLARINFSHGEADDHRQRVAAIRRTAAERGVPVAILGDIQGPKLRLGLFPGGRATVQVGDRYRLVESSDVARQGEIPFNVEGLLAAVQPGHRVFLADGVVEIVVEAFGQDCLIGRVRRGGVIGDRKGVNLPDSSLEVELPTEKDLRDLVLARELGLDFVGISFVGRAEDVRTVRKLVPDLQVVAKIERLSALEEIRDILAETDGIMVARGDLGVEVELEQLPVVQKALIQEALRAGKFTITATEMLESMVTSTRPTRAEVADVANAILDGTDAVMLSAETAVGRYPVEAVEVMQRVALAVENSQSYRDLPPVAFREAERTFSNATAMGAAQIAEALGLGRIVCFTESGNTVRQISRYRPSAEIIGMTPHESTLRQMSVLADVRPVRTQGGSTLENMLARGCDELLAAGLVAVGEELVFVAGVPPGKARSTNVIKLHRIGDALKLH